MKTILRTGNWPMWKQTTNKNFAAMEPNTLYEGVNFTTEQVMPRLVKQHNAWSIIRTYTNIDGKVYTSFLGKGFDGFETSPKMLGYLSVAFETRREARIFASELNNKYIPITPASIKFKVVKVLIAMADVR